MRKILAFVICCFGMVVMPSFASTATCVPVACNTSMGDDRLNADTLENTRQGRRSAASCYICEDGYCTDGDIVYKGDFSKFVVCRQSFGWIGNDRWEDYTPGYCDDEMNLETEAMRGNSGLAKFWKIDGVRYGDREATLNGARTTLAGQNVCYYYACQEGSRFDTEQRKCVSGASVSQPTQPKPETVEEPAETGDAPTETVGAPTETVDETVSSPELSNTERCIRNRCGGLSGSTRSQCVGCCDVPSSVAIWNKNTRVCECPNTSTHVFNPSTLQCEPIEPSTPSQPVASTSQSVTQVQSSESDYECDQTQINNLLTLQVQYATNTSIVAQINQVIEYCDGDPSEIVFNSMINQINIAISGVNTQAEQNQANQRIDQAVATLNTIRDGLRVNKWRNEEGKFNTSRLLSDSIAGVVLGTAGGLITSSVVKKSQVSDGFEDMQCTIGGQVVAGWGDQFRVGIQ